MVARRLQVFVLLAGVISLPADAAGHREPFERLSAARISAVQEEHQAVIDHRHNKRIMAGAVTGMTVRALVGAIIYRQCQPEKPEPAEGIEPLSKSERNRISANVIQQLLKERQELRTASGIMKYKFSEGLALGLASAVVTFILTQSSNASESAFPFIEHHLPLNDMPLLTKALRQAVEAGRHYNSALLRILANPTTPGSFASEIMTSTKQSEHRHLVVNLESLAAWLPCFADELGAPTMSQVQTVLHTLTRTIEQLALQYELPAGMNLETPGLIGSISLQIEQLATIILARVRELGYEL